MLFSAHVSMSTAKDQACNRGLAGLNPSLGMSTPTLKAQYQKCRYPCFSVSAFNNQGKEQIYYTY